MVKTFRFHLFAVLFLAFVAVPARQGTGEAGEAKYTLRFNHVLTDSDPFHKAFLKWSDAVAKRTNGEVKIEVFHGGQLGIEEDIIEQIRSGAPIGQNTDAGRMGGYMKEFAAMNLPYFIESLQDAENLVKSPLLAEWRQRMEDEHGIHIMSLFYIQGPRNIFTNKPCPTPASLSGVRIRTAPTQAWQEAIRSLGATPVGMGFGEVYSAVQTKAIDGCELADAVAYHSSIYEVCKFANATGHINLNNFQITSAEWFRSLPEEYQKIIDEECDNAGREMSYDIMNRVVFDAKKMMQEKGVTYVEVDKEVFKKAGKKAYEAMGLLETRNKLFEEMGKKAD